MELSSTVRHAIGHRFEEGELSGSIAKPTAWKRKALRGIDISVGQQAARNRRINRLALLCAPPVSLACPSEKKRTLTEEMVHGMVMSVGKRVDPSLVCNYHDHAAADL